MGHLTYDQYQKGLARGKFLGLACNRCHSVTFPPKSVCRSCSGTDCRITEMNGEGTIRTFTVIRVPPEGMTAPYIIMIAELDEGAWAMGNLEGVDPDAAGLDLIGKRVRMGSRRVRGITYMEDERVLTFSLDDA
ncbi:MAG: hypothetical protein DRH56_05225 [Deltaproteobacteria bacterium]|nr:MAG: hypothetical protein DRH56_05225 [Deltaproteobacteria bacterium]